MNVTRQSLTLLLGPGLPRPIGQIALGGVELEEQARAERRLPVGAVDVEHDGAERDARRQERHDP